MTASSFLLFYFIWIFKTAFEINILVEMPTYCHIPPLKHYKNLEIYSKTEWMIFCWPIIFQTNYCRLYNGSYHIMCCDFFILNHSMQHLMQYSLLYYLDNVVMCSYITPKRTCCAYNNLCFNYMMYISYHMPELWKSIIIFFSCDQPTNVLALNYLSNYSLCKNC